MASSAVAQELYTELECEVYHELEEFVGDPRFCAALERPAPGNERLMARATGWATGWRRTAGGREQRAPKASAAVAEPLLGQQAGTEDGEGVDGAAQDDFVVVDRHDVIESMAMYIAACIIDLPEAQALTPKQLQAALLDALKCLKRSRFRQACSWGCFVYRWTAYSASLLQMYQNPWLMRALLTALWATSRVSMRLLL